MQSNLGSTFGTAICYNGNPGLNYLQIQQQQQQQQNLISANQLNTINTNIISQSNVDSSTPLQNDTTFTKIFVGGLPYHTTDESLRNFFSKFGNIEEAVVINDRQTGKSRGYGFVTMETKEAAEAAIQDPNPIIDGRKANVNLAYLGVKSRTLTANSIIPLAIRYQLPSTAPPTTFGFHPFYYHPTTAGANGVPTQPAFTNTFLTTTPATPNLLMSTQNTQIPPTTISPNKATLLSSAYDLSSAYAATTNAAAPTNQLNTNRQSPFDAATAAAIAANANLIPNPFLQPFTSTNQNALNSILNTTQSNVNYFTLPQFQSQLQDRL